MGRTAQHTQAWGRMLEKFLQYIAYLHDMLFHHDGYSRIKNNFLQSI